MQSQSYDHRIINASIQEGLSSEYINSIYQGKDGFIWVSTKRGVDRYDGYKFTPIELPDSLSFGAAEHFMIDKSGRKYISTENEGIIVINNDLTSWKIYKTNAFGENFYLPSIFEDSKNNIWILSYGQGLSHLDVESEQLTSYVHSDTTSNSIGDNQIYQMVEGPNGMLWLGTENGGLVRFNPETGEFKNYQNDPKDKLSIPGNKSYGLVVDDDKIWISLYLTGLCLFDIEKETFTLFSADDDDPQSLSSNFLWPLDLDEDKGLWIGTQDKGLDYLDFKSMTFKIKEKKATLNVKGSRIRCLYADHEGNLWFSSVGNGLNMYDRNKYNFEILSHDPLVKSSISSNDIISVVEDKSGGLWISHAKSGVDFFDRKTGTYINYSTESKEPFILSDDNVQAMIIDNNNQLWIGTKFGGINQINADSKIAKSFVADKDNIHSPRHNWTFSLMEDSDNNIWLSGFSAISKINTKTYEFEHILIDKKEDNPNTPAGETIKSIFEDSQGIFWLDSEKGIEKYNPRTSLFELTEHDFDPLFRDKDDVWMVSQGELSVFNYISESYIHFEIDQDIVVNSIEKDNYGHLWLSCNDGIRRFDSQTREIEHYNRHDGLNSDLFLFGSYCSPTTGKLFFNSKDGINAFHPDEVKKDTFLPKIKFTSLSYFDSKRKENKPIPHPNISQTSDVTFPHSYNIISIEFAALSYKKSPKNQYKYKIKELNENWIDLDNERNITLTNLSPRSYTLEVIGSNGDGVWNKNPTTLNIKITPPWYKSLWAYIIYLLGALFTIWQYIRHRESEQKRKLIEERLVVERLKEIDKLKDVFLANTSHELRTPLNGIIGLSESLRDGVAGPLPAVANENLKMIINSGRRLVNLVNDILDFSKLKNHELSLKISPVDIKAATDVVISLTETMVQNKDLTIINSIDPDIVLVDADENRLQQILYNLIGNAIKFTHSGIIEISSYSSDNLLFTTISDTGIGIPEDKIEEVFKSFDQVDGSTERSFGGTGLGLTITKQLVEQHSGTIILKSEVGKGTQITFSLPKSETDRSDALELDFNEPFSTAITDINIDKSLEVALPIGVKTKAENQNIKILIVDDEPVNRQVLTNFLSLEGYQSYTANDGHEALSMIDEEDYNLILLDIMMPKLSGYDVAKKVRETYLPSALPIIMLTAKNRINDLVQGFNVGANDYLAKPFVKKELMSRIKTHLYLQKIINTSSQFVPDAFIKSVGRNEITDVKLGDYAEKIVTVLFTDIRNYTGLSEQMTPHDNFEFVRSYVGKMGPIIQQNEGFVNQYLGDGLMCIFDGVSSNALDASIEMQKAIVTYNEVRKKQKRIPIRVGMGMCTGPLVMGIIGDKMRKDPATIASTVNLASRIEGLTKHLQAQILLDRITVDGLEDKSKYNLRSLGKIIVKGQANSIELIECFDSNDPDQVELKINTLDQFDEAIGLFRAAELDKSVKIFQDIIDINPADRIARFLVQKIEYERSHIEAHLWNGILKLDIK